MALKQVVVFNYVAPPLRWTFKLNLKKQGGAIDLKSDFIFKACIFSANKIMRALPNAQKGPLLDK